MSKREKRKEIIKLINFKELSRRLSGNESSVRSSSLADKYYDQVESLISVVEKWGKENPAIGLKNVEEKKVFEVEIEEKPRIVKKISQAKVQIEKVPEEKRGGVFIDLKPAISNLTQNGECYKVRMMRMKPTEEFIGYFMVKENALEYIELISGLERNGKDLAGPEYHKYR